MKGELPKSYNSDAEFEIYSLWEASGLLNPDNMAKYLEEEGYEIILPPSDFDELAKALDRAGISCASAAITQLPELLVPVSSEMAETVQKLLDALEDHDDVKEVFSNADM